MDNDIMHELASLLESIGDAIDNERIHTDRQWKLYMNELWQWVDSLLGRDL